MTSIFAYNILCIKTECTYYKPFVITQSVILYIIRENKRERNNIFIVVVIYNGPESIIL